MSESKPILTRGEMIARLFRRREVVQHKPRPRKLPGRCWLFEGCSYTGDEYGQIRIGGKLVYTHRLAAHLWLNMPLDSPSVVRHCCLDSKKCFQPLHLKVGSIAENNGDLVEQGKHSRATLTDRDVILLIRAVRRGRISIGKWAAVNKVSYTTVYNAYHGIYHSEISAATHARCDARPGAAVNGAAAGNRFVLPDVSAVRAAIADDEAAYAVDEALIDLPF